MNGDADNDDELGLYQEALVDEIEVLIQTNDQQQPGPTVVVASKKESEDDTTETDDSSDVFEEDPWHIATRKTSSEAEKTLAYWNLCYGRVILPTGAAHGSPCPPLKSCLRKNSRPSKPRGKTSLSTLQFSQSSAVTYSCDDPVQDSLQTLDHAAILYPVDCQPPPPLLPEESDRSLTVNSVVCSNNQSANNSESSHFTESSYDEEASIDVFEGSVTIPNKRRPVFRMDETFRMDSNESLGLASLEGTTTMGMSSIPLDTSTGSFHSSVSSFENCDWEDSNSSFLPELLPQEEESTSYERETKDEDDKVWLPSSSFPIACCKKQQRTGYAAPPPSVASFDGQLRSLAEHEWNLYEASIQEAIDTTTLDDPIQVLQALREDEERIHDNVPADDKDSLKSQLEQQTLICSSQHYCSWKKSLQSLLLANRLRFGSENALELIVCQPHALSILVNMDGTAQVCVREDGTGNDNAFYTSLLRAGLQIVFTDFDIPQLPKLLVFLDRVSDVARDVQAVAQSVTVSEGCIVVKTEAGATIVYDLTQRHLVFACLPRILHGVEPACLQGTLQQCGMSKLLQTLCKR